MAAVVVPVGKNVPEVGPVVVTPGQLSVAVTVNGTAAPQTPGSLLTMMFAGTVNEGFSVSFTVTEKALVLVFPCASVAVTLTVVVPTGKVEPEAGVLRNV